MVHDGVYKCQIFEFDGRMLMATSGHRIPQQVYFPIVLLVSSSAIFIYTVSFLKRLKNPVYEYHTMLLRNFKIYSRLLYMVVEAFQVVESSIDSR